MPRRRAVICVLLSGGLDSAFLLRHSLQRHGRVFPLYVRCGLRWEASELYWLQRLLRAIPHDRLASLRVIDAPLRSTYGAHWSLTGRRLPGARSADHAVYLPGRNVLLLTHAAIVGARDGVHTFALGLLQGNPFGDASSTCLAHLARCLSLALGRPIRILTPLAHLDKAELIRRAAAQLPLQLTWSCLRPGPQRHCGRCNKCAERRQAFRNAGIPDPTSYRHCC